MEQRLSELRLAKLKLWAPLSGDGGAASENHPRYLDRGIQTTPAVPGKSLGITGFALLLSQLIPRDERRSMDFETVD